MTELAIGVRSATRAWRSRNGMILASLALLLVVALLMAGGIGAVGISPGGILAILASKLGLALPWEFTPRQEHVLTAIRLPRVLLGLLVGGGLAVSGAMMQGLFRNPLADPSLIGTSSGAALGAVTVLVLGGAATTSIGTLLGDALLPAAAFLGGIGSTTLVYRISRARAAGSMASMLLAGIALNALFAAALGALVYLADDAQLRSITFWNMGSLGGATWRYLAVAAPLILMVILLAPRLARELNALALGEAEAAHLGVGVEGVRRAVVLLTALAVGTSVAVCGMIGFVGLVAPHIVRLMVGPDHRVVIPGSALLGASLLLIADLLARTIVVPAELPIGIVTAAFGAPVFLWLILRRRGLVGEEPC